MPTQPSELSSALLDGRIYVAGGTHVKGFTYARKKVYDPQMDTWSDRPALPVASSGLTAAYFENKYT